MTDRATRPPAPTGRLRSLDQFRGYTVLAMLAVNFLGGFDVVPGLFKHDKRHCSFADTVMPQFFFAMGMAYRLSFQKRLARMGKGPAYRHALIRGFALIVLGLVVYQVDFQVGSWQELRTRGLLGLAQTLIERRPFQALVHIGLTALWVMPVIGARAAIVAVFLLASACLHVVLSQWFYFDHAWRTGVIDGGPLGFISWTIPTLAGALAYDALVAGPRRRAGLALLMAGLGAMSLGQLLTALGPNGIAPPPFVPLPPERSVDLWTMSQRSGSVSYLTFSSGFSLVLLALFVGLCDGCQFELGLFRTLGMNPLLAYLIHEPVGSLVTRYVPHDAPAWYVGAALALYLALCCGALRALEKQEIFLRL